MGNDLKIPSSHRKRLQELQTKSKGELKEYLISEIRTVSRAIDTLEHEITRIASSSKQLEYNIEHYKKIIIELSTKLEEIKLEQINMSLAQENYVNKANIYLQELEETAPALETDDEDVDLYSVTKIKELEEKVELLNAEVAKNQEFINKKWEELFG